MKQKIFLTSVIAMGFVAPAMAEPSNTDTFPQSGLMQEDYTYTNAATSTNMAGVYEGEVNAVAQYTDNLYQLVAGQYLPANSETPIDCDQNGYFCPGDNNGVYYSSSAQGLTQCPSGYGNSGTGASANTDCYRTCDIANMGANGSIANIAHATAISGNDYYGNGTDTCVPTSCENGWHVKTASPDLMDVIGTSEAGTGHTANIGSGSEDFSQNMSNTIISGDPMAFAVDYGNKGIIKGHGRCSTRSATDPWVNVTYTLQQDNIVQSLTDETGQSGAQYCYCQLDSYTPYGSQTSITLSGPWVYYNNTKTDCDRNCAFGCVAGIKNIDYNTTFRAVIFSLYPASSAMCEANTITINWDGASATEINANNAGTATYGSDIRTPRSATPVPGKTFTGWRFVAPQQASVQEP